jgi:hypothetical protein
MSMDSQASSDADIHIHAVNLCVTLLWQKSFRTCLSLHARASNFRHVFRAARHANFLLFCGSLKDANINAFCARLRNIFCSVVCFFGV